MILKKSDDPFLLDYSLPAARNSVKPAGGTVKAAGLTLFPAGRFIINKQERVIIRHVAGKRKEPGFEKSGSSCKL